MTNAQSQIVKRLEQQGWTLMVVENNVAHLCNYTTGKWMKINENGTEIPE